MMKFSVYCASLAVAGLVGSSAIAGEWADACVERLEADGRPTDGCSCVEAEIRANPSLEEEFIQLGEIEDPAARFAAATSDAQAVMNKCTR